VDPTNLKKMRNDDENGNDDEKKGELSLCYEVVEPHRRSFCRVVGGVLLYGLRCKPQHGGLVVLWEIVRVTSRFITQLLQLFLELPNNERCYHDA
jgi:hypothetical protein